MDIAIEIYSITKKFKFNFYRSRNDLQYCAKFRSRYFRAPENVIDLKAHISGEVTREISFQFLKSLKYLFQTLYRDRFNALNFNTDLNFKLNLSFISVKSV